MPTHRLIVYANDNRGSRIVHSIYEKETRQQAEELLDELNFRVGEFDEQHGVKITETRIEELPSNGEAVFVGHDEDGLAIYRVPSGFF